MENSPAPGPYDDASYERYAPRPSYLSETNTWMRSPFDEDLVSLSHSDFWRRLGDKTQVGGQAGTSSMRWRMSHSLEVAKIAKAIGTGLGCDRDLLEFAGMAHDLGHPPFGHTGEGVLDEVAQDCGGFEGNAQTFRILTRLEYKFVATDGSPVGLNLTRACLDAATKYPWPRREGVRKFGVYEQDLPIFEWMRKGAPRDTLSLEAQIMDWADDVAYALSDLEDGVRSGQIQVSYLDEPEARDEICEIAARRYSPEPAHRLRPILDEFLETNSAELFGLRRFDKGMAAKRALEHLTARLRQEFVMDAVEHTRLAHDGATGPPLRRYDADLHVPEPTRAGCALLKAVNFKYVITDPSVSRTRDLERSILAELVATYLRRPALLDTETYRQWQEATDAGVKQRIVIDRLARMTNSSALYWHTAHVVGRSSVIDLPPVRGGQAHSVLPMHEMVEAHEPVAGLGGKPADLG